MKISLGGFALSVLAILLIVSCTLMNSPDEEAQPSPAWVATKDAQEEYSKALSRWQSHSISNYEITVDIFSSMLAPPCSAKATLAVQDNKLVTTREIETSMPIQMADGGAIYNPECHEYENYLLAKQFEVVGDLLAGQLPYGWNVKFDAEYGFVTDLTYTTGGESTKIVRYFGFQPK